MLNADFLKLSLRAATEWNSKWCIDILNIVQIRLPDIGAAISFYI